MIDAFKAALIAAGFTAKTAQRIFVEERGDGPDQDGAGTASAGLPGYAAGGNGERK